MPLMRLALPVLLAAADQWQPWETTTPAVVVDNSIAVQVLPEFAEPGAKLSETAAEWASADSSISAERLRAAKAGRRAYEAELQAVEEQVEAAKGGDGLREKVEKVRKLRAKTMEAARMTGRLALALSLAAQNDPLRIEACNVSILIAQDLQMKANDLMEKAAPMSKEAIIYQDVAQLMSKERSAMKALEAGS
eukprot:g27458.t1